MILRRFVFHASWLMAAMMLLLMVSAGCSDGPGFIGGHDYSAFYDFGGRPDVAMPDGFTHDSERDATGADLGGEVLTPDQGRDPGQTDPGGVDTIQDTSLPTPSVVFVTNKAWETRANSMIGGAKRSVDLIHLSFAQYSPDDISVANSLKGAAGRGVPVRVLLDDSPENNLARVEELNKINNITAKLDDWNGTTHVKLLVVDDEQILVGSTNLSKASLHFNNEANLWLNEPETVQEFVEYVDSVWNSPSTRRGMEADVSTSGILPIGDQEYINAVSPLIDGATDRILLVMYNFNPDSNRATNLAEGLKSAAGKGVTVKVILERCHLDYAEYVTQQNEEMASFLEQGGVEVRFDEPYPDNNTYDDITHAKLLIVDDTVVVYSGNWNESGLNNNHEAGALVHGVDSVTTAAVAYFNSIFNVGFDWP